MVDEVRLLRGDDGGVVDARSGQVVVLALAENPTTGYRWAVTADGLDLVDQQYAPTETSAIGGGGVRTFRFAARRAGDGIVRATLKRAWQADESAVDRAVFHLRIV